MVSSSPISRASHPGGTRRRPGRQLEVATDIGESHHAGFGAYHRTVDCFTALLDRYRGDGLIPAA